MEHKAFVFDHEDFETELSETLYAALQGGSLQGLTDFIARHWRRLKDCDGEPLSPSWQSQVEPQDAHQYGDLALTKFYDPCADIGLGYRWERLAQTMRDPAADFSTLLLGRPFGPPENPFDPGKMGSYFCSTPEAQENYLRLLELQKNPDVCGELPAAIKMFHHAKVAGKGLYATF